MKKKKVSKFKISSIGKKNGLSSINGTEPAYSGTCLGQTCCSGGAPQPY